MVKSPAVFFMGETFFKGLSSTTEIWLKLCIHYWGEFRKVFVVMRSPRHFSKHNPQVYSSLCPTICWVYPYHKIKHTFTLCSSRISTGTFLQLLFLPLRHPILSFIVFVFLYLIKHSLLIDLSTYLLILTCGPSQGWLPLIIISLERMGHIDSSKE